MDPAQCIDFFIHTHGTGPPLQRPIHSMDGIPAILDGVKSRGDQQQPEIDAFLPAIQEGIRNFLLQTNSILEFQKVSNGEIVARVVEPSTGKVIREYPVIAILKILQGIDRQG